MLDWVRKKEPIKTIDPLQIDIHSHLLPRLDDGVQSYEESEDVILHFKKLGYKKLITTPHVMSDAYKNTTKKILARLDKLRMYLENQEIDMQIEAAAEYYLDEQVYQMVEQNEEMLTFGKNFLLFETNFLNEPFNMKEFIFLATTKGYKPVLAHPERYLYLQNNLEKAEDLIDRGVLFQMNISSITGFYSKIVQTTAHKLIDKGWVHLLGSDCHHLQHVRLVEEAQQLKYFQKALSLPLLNNSL
ncbi:MAG: capsular biosynthesis protein [Cyclobacteriaceae bacterium]|nr:capsular biosynthesis protein [Cyclobacteriaceae bacterium]MDH4297556.1 capsular biosynthesis protein [Cyclobacteriaceae bacterium]MDH5249968.1 capsular biosynthesis protein [Cyclobacteriaceae bacterium]